MLILAEPIPPTNDIIINIIKLKNVPFCESKIFGRRLASIAPPALYCNDMIAHCIITCATITINIAFLSYISLSIFAIVLYPVFLNLLIMKKAAITAPDAHAILYHPALIPSLTAFSAIPIVDAPPIAAVMNALFFPL